MADIKNSKTPAVQGNALKNLTVDDLSRESLGVLAVRNPDSYNQKLLGYIDPTYLQLRLQVKDELLEILNNAHKNNYIVKIPIDIQSEPYYSSLGLTGEGLKKILALLPDLNLISAGYLLNSKNIDNPCWKVSWDFDGVFGTQIAEFKGLVFSRHAKYDNKKGTTTWTNWGFHNDTQYIGMTRMDFSNIPHGTNVMGWIKVPAGNVKLKKEEYPKLFEYLTKSGAFNENEGIIKVTETDLEISDPAGFFPRIVGSQTINGFNSNPDHSNAKASDNYDYANRHWSMSGSINQVGGYVGVGGCFSGRIDPYQSSGTAGSGGNWSFYYYYINLNYEQQHPYSHNETRPKTKFYNLLIYAGYPIKIN